MPEAFSFVEARRGEGEHGAVADVADEEAETFPLEGEEEDGVFREGAQWGVDVGACVGMGISVVCELEKSKRTYLGEGQCRLGLFPGFYLLV